MNESFRTVYDYATGEVSVKKSRFIASIYPISTEEEALRYIDQVKKEHPAARHNCYAYVIGRKNEQKRLSDDGEPAKTAGMPIMDLIIQENLRNILIVVTRYFGGTLLGTGGLVHAYQSAAKEGLLNAKIIEKLPCIKSELQIDYTLTGKLKYTIAQMGIFLLKEEYLDKVTLTLLIPVDAFTAFQQSLVELTAGKLNLAEGEKLLFSVVNGNIITFIDN